MICGIYCLTNVITGKRYVGQSINIAARWRQHQKSREPFGISSAIAKHGWQSFVAEVIEECPADKLNEAEAAWITKLGTLSPGGYNLRSGGGQNAAFSEDVRARISEATRRGLTPEVLAKRRESMKGIPKSPEWRAAMSERQKNPKNIERITQMARNQSAETRAKNSASNLGRKVSEEGRARMRAAAKLRCESRAKAPPP